MFQGRTPPHSGSSSYQQARTKAKAVAPPPVRLLVPAVGGLGLPNAAACAQQTLSFPKAAACAAPRLVLPKAACAAAPPVVHLSLLGPAAGVPGPPGRIPDPQTPPEMRVPSPRTPMEIFQALGCSSKAAAAPVPSYFGSSGISIPHQQHQQQQRQQLQQQQLPNTPPTTQFGIATPPTTEFGIGSPPTTTEFGIGRPPALTGDAVPVPFTPMSFQPVTPLTGDAVPEPLTPMSFQPVTPPLTQDAVPLTPLTGDAVPGTPLRFQPVTPTSSCALTTEQQHFEWPVTPSILSPTRCGRAASSSSSSSSAPA